MYIIIAGGGLIGKGLAQRLVESKHDVVVIDLDPKVCEEIYAEYGAVTISGSATELRTLEHARIERCDVAVGAMRRDPNNLAFALLAKHFKVPQILVRMIDPVYEDVYKSAGVTNIARTTDLMIDQLLVNIESPDLRKVISLGDEIEIGIVSLPESSPLSGKTIAEVTSQSGFPSTVRVACVFSEEKSAFVVAQGDLQVAENDRLFLCATRDDIRRASSVLQKT